MLPWIALGRKFAATRVIWLAKPGQRRYLLTRPPIGGPPLKCPIATFEKL